jgi:hypothetical protein
MAVTPHCRPCLSLWIAFAIANAIAVVAAVAAEPERGGEKPAATASSQDTADRQATLDAALSKMLSGATLEGSFTQAGPGSDPAKLDREKYTLGEVKRVAGEVWQFPARIEYGGKDVTLPIRLPVRWAGDTPVVVVDAVDLPGFGSVSARVLFFGGHYAGYWKHGYHSGNLFGAIRQKGQNR